MYHLEEYLKNKFSFFNQVIGYKSCWASCWYKHKITKWVIYTNYRKKLPKIYWERIFETHTSVYYFKLPCVFLASWAEPCGTLRILPANSENINRWRCFFEGASSFSLPSHPNLDPLHLTKWFVRRGKSKEKYLLSKNNNKAGRQNWKAAMSQLYFV